jgi:hypothetical protein
MDWLAISAVSVMFLLPAGPQPENPWRDKVPAAVATAEHAGTVAAYREALDVAWRADDWQAGLRLAQDARRRHPHEGSLMGRIARALWRGGELPEAERVVDAIPADTRDHVALTTVIDAQLARGRFESARAAARRLEQLGPATATECYGVAAVRLSDDRLAGIVPLLRKAIRLVNPENGYPETYLGEVLDGLPEFFEAIGTEPINQLTNYGSAAMPMVPLVRLPYCLGTINGRGPYRLILDTGGSITLALDDDVARELGLKSLGTAPIRGVSGKQNSEQILVDELQIGEITCRRVMTRAFAMPPALEVAADGIIGTGVFSQARMTLDFGTARLIVAPSSEQVAPGHAGELRIVGDAKLVAPIKLEGQYALALLDSGADVAAISPARLKELFPDREFATVGAAGLGVGQGEATGISLAPGVELTLWGRTYENYSGLGLEALDTLLSPLLGTRIQVLLGMAVFRDTKSWTIDYPHRRMWIEWVKQ